MIPEKIGRYEVREELGRGGMATVYRAYDPSFDREVAIKVLPKEFLHDPNFQERFKREVKIIAALEHPAIVPVYDFGEDDSSPYFVMRYMPGGSLTSRQIDRGTFSMLDTARIIDKLASAMEYAHKKGIVHRDLKPDNILFDSNDDPCISDFGVASFISINTNLTGNAAIGTPAYMSPEQAQGDKVDSRSDVYALGVIIYKMLSGQHPYKADTPMGVALKQITDPVPEILKVNPDLPAEIDAIIKTAMAKKKEDRYPSVTELAQAFDRVANSGSAGVALHQGSLETVSSLPEISRAVLSALSNNRRGLIGAVVVAVILPAIIMGIVFKSWLSTQSQPIPAGITPPAVDATVRPAAATASGFFTEEFNGNLDANWKYFIAGGPESQLISNIQNGFMNFDIEGRDLHYYTYYTPKTYDNVRIDMRAENLGDTNSSVLILCRYNESKGWYEFNINSGGLYEILYSTLNVDNIHVSSSRIANGGTNLIKVGKAVNEYSATCSDRTLSLSINGTMVKSIEDNRFMLENGYAGFGAMSDKVRVQIGIDSVSLSQP